MSKLRMWREGKGWSLADVSGLTGMSEPMISKVETGQRQFAPETKVRVARCLGASVRDLFEVEEVADVAS